MIDYIMELLNVQRWYWVSVTYIDGRGRRQFSSLMAKGKKLKEDSFNDFLSSVANSTAKERDCDRETVEIIYWQEMK